MDILTLAIAKNKFGSANETITTENITNALGYKPANQEDLRKLSEDIADLKENGTGTGLTDDLKTALKNYFTNMQTLLPQLAYIAEENMGNTLISNAQAVVTALDSSGGSTEPDIPDEPIEPDNPEVTLTSISATYTGGEVTVGTSVNSLTGITVKAHYSDGSTSNVTGYTLSGTIVEGSNTTTVSYGGKTTTFTVTGVAESGGEETEVSNETTWTDGVAYTYTALTNSYVEKDGTITAYEKWARTPYLYCDGVSKLRVSTVLVNSHMNANTDYNCFYDTDKNFISKFDIKGVDGNTVGSYKDIDVPENAVYFIASNKHNVISGESPNAYGHAYISFTPYA